MKYLLIILIALLKLKECKRVTFCHENSCDFIDTETSQFSVKFLEPDQYDIEDLNRFLNKINQEVGNIRIGESKDRLGVFSQVDLTEYDKLLKINEKYVFTDLSLEHSNYLRDPLITQYDEFPSIIEQINDKDLQVAMILLHHFYYFDASPFQPYLKMLPVKPNDMLLTLTDENLERFIRGTDLYDTIKKERSQLKFKYDYLKQILKMTWNPHQISKFFNGNENLPFYDFLVVNFLVSTRAWNFKGSKVMIPGADFFNHQEGKSENYGISHYGDNFLRYHQKDNQGNYIIFCESTVHKDQEIRESYGDNPNEIYMVYHGFVPKINEDECINFQFINKDVWKKLNKFSRKLAEMVGVRGPTMCLNQYNYKKMIASIQVLNLDENQAQSCLNQMQSHHTNQNQLLNADFVIYNCNQAEISIFNPINDILTQSRDIKMQFTEYLHNIMTTQELDVVQQYYQYKLLTLNDLLIQFIDLEMYFSNLYVKNQIDDILYRKEQQSQNQNEYNTDDL